jgi:metallophosphoesterase superfamily enzyme
VKNGPKISLDLRNGTVIVFSDAHYWPGQPTTAHRGLVKLVKALKPALVVANGDMIDGARIGRFPRLGWNHAPKLRDELQACDCRLAEVERAAPRSSRLIWPEGNHDMRFENYLANHVDEFAGIAGFTLKDHFPTWEPCMQLVINKDTVIKHRWKGGRGAN